MNHDNIKSFIGACVEPGHICYLMQFCSRGTVKVSWHLHTQLTSIKFLRALFSENRKNIDSLYRLSPTRLARKWWRNLYSDLKLPYDNLVNLLYYLFFYRVTLCLRGICCRRVSLCPLVRPSVYHKPVLYRNQWTNRSGFGMEASFQLSHLVF